MYFKCSFNIPKNLTLSKIPKNETFVSTGNPVSNAQDSKPPGGLRLVRTGFFRQTSPVILPLRSAVSAGDNPVLFLKDCLK